jgi:hypothetical protein
MQGRNRLLEIKQNTPDCLLDAPCLSTGDLKTYQDSYKRHFDHSFDEDEVAALVSCGSIGKHRACAVGTRQNSIEAASGVGEGQELDVRNPPMGGTSPESRAFPSGSMTQWRSQLEGSATESVTAVQAVCVHVPKPRDSEWSCESVGVTDMVPTAEGRALGSGPSSVGAESGAGCIADIFQNVWGVAGVGQQSEVVEQVSRLPAPGGRRRTSVPSRACAVQNCP